MGAVSGIVVFLLTWWIVLFAVLPFGVRHGEHQVGDMPGAPLKPNFKKIILRTTIVTIVIWLVIYGLVESDVISFRQMAKTL